MTRGHNQRLLPKYVDRQKVFLLLLVTQLNLLGKFILHNGYSLWISHQLYLERIPNSMTKEIPNSMTNQRHGLDRFYKEPMSDTATNSSKLLIQSFILTDVMNGQLSSRVQLGSLDVTQYG